MADLIVDFSAASDFRWLHHANRPVHQLSDNSWVAVLLNNNGASYTIRHSTDRATWSLKTTFAPAEGSDSLSGYAVTIDDSNNLYLAWISIAGDLRYIKFTYAAGPTWTAGTAETVRTKPVDGGGISYWLSHPAIEWLSGAAIVVGHLEMQTTEGGGLVYWGYRVRHTGGAWGTAVNGNFAGGSSADASAHSLYIARDSAGPTANVEKFLATYCGGTSSPFVSEIVPVNITTGAVAAGGTFVDSDDEPVTGEGYTMMVIPFSAGAGKWRLAYYKTTGGSGTFGVLEVGTDGQGVASGASTVGNYSIASFPQQSRANFMALPDRIVCLGLVDPLLEITSAVFSGTTVSFTGTHKVTPSGLSSAIDGNWFVLGGETIRNVTGTEHLMLLWRTDLAQMYSNFLAAPTVAPSSVTPASGSTVTTDIPTLQANLNTGSSNDRYKAGWELATDSGFTASVKAVAQPDNGYLSGTNTAWSLVLPTASQLSQTTWFIRGRRIDVLGQTGPWSTGHSFTVSHPPSATPATPSGGTTLEFGTGTKQMEWAFSDGSPVDPQTAYQIIVERNSDGLSIVDTGKVVATGFAPNNAYGIPTIGRGNVTIPGAYKDVMLRWKVRVWDSDDVVGSYSSYSLFQVADPPGISITTPASGGVIDNPQPLFVWDFTGPAGRTQSTYRVIVKTAVGDTVHDSGVKSGAVESYQLPQALLSNLGSYTVQVEVVDNLGLTNSDTNNFTTSWTPPAVPTDIGVNALNFDTDGFVSIFWDSSVRDVDFYAWRVYRRVQGETSFVLLYETTSPTFDLYEDWSAQSGVTYEYNVVQVANRFGSLMESAHTWQAPVTPNSSHYWLLHPDDSNKNIKLFHVISEDFTEEYESATLNLIGRGRHTDYGTRYGYSGTVVCEIRNYDGKTARQIKQEIEGIKAEKRELYLRNPFGDLWLVSLGDLATSRLAGTGTNEYCTVTIPYQEVS